MPVTRAGRAVTKEVVGTFENIQELRDSVPQAGTFSVAGYYVAGDGGGGPLRVWKTGAIGTYVDNGGSIIVPTGGDGSGAWVWEYSGHSDVAWFGAVGDGASDDLLLLRAAIASGLPLDFKGRDYLVSGRIGEDATLEHEIRWKSSGANIILDQSVAHIADVVAYRIKPGNHVIDGQLTINANNKANIGFGLRNSQTVVYPTSFATFKATGLGAINCRREAAFRAGNGIRIEGSFFSVILDNPVVKNCVLATGAGVSGITGITGIAVSRDGDSGGYSLYTEINNPWIDGVETEDLTWTADQDGIQLFGSSDANTLYNSFLVQGGTFTNCFGRSIKSQMATGRVEGSTFVRTRGFNGNIGVGEVDFQGGMGFVHDINCDYNTFVPSTVVSQRSTDNNRTQGLVDGIAIKIAGLTTLPSIVSTYSSPPLAPLVVRNLTCIGPVEYAINIRSPQAVSYVTLEDSSFTEITDSLIRAASGGSNVLPAESVQIDVRRIVNTGTARRLVRQNIPGTSVSGIVTADNIIGFTGSTGALTGNPSEGDGPMIVKTIPNLSLNKSPLGATLMSESFNVANGDTVGFKNPGVSLTYFVAQFNNDATAIFGSATSSGGRLTELASGSSVNIGTSSIPATNTFMIWPDTVNSLINIKNTSGSTRTCTLMYFTF